MLKAGLATATAIAGLALVPAVAGATEMKVNTTADGFLADGKCGLREAVEAANENQKQTGCPKGQGGKRDVIVLKGVTYDLTVPSTNEDVNTNGDLDLTGGGPVTIRGAGRDETEIDAPSNDRAIDLHGSASSLKLEKLRVDQGDVTAYAGFDAFGGTIRTDGGALSVLKATLSSGDAVDGGIVYSFGRFTSDRSTLTSGDASSDGAALVAAGPTTVKRSVMNSNEAESSTNDVRGGAVFASGSGPVTITDTALRGNSADTTGGAVDAFGGAIYADEGTVTVGRSEFSNNGATALTNGQEESGGNVYVDGGATVELLNTTLLNGNTGGPDGAGGNLYNAGTVEARFTSFIDGAAPAFADQIYTAGTTSVGQSIINLDESFDPCAGATVTTLGYNVAEFDDPACGYGPFDGEDEFLNLGSLSANGGPTQTVAFSANSTGPDFVPKDVCKATTKRDQRGFARPNTKKVGKKKVKQPCDAGAFEQGAKAP
jgi:CSLREA domain-containing protein